MEKLERGKGHPVWGFKSITRSGGGRPGVRLWGCGGAQGFGWEGDSFSEAERGATRAWLHSRAITIYGGTNEIQLNIIAKRVLGLPD